MMTPMKLYRADSHLDGAMGTASSCTSHSGAVRPLDTNEYRVVDNAPLSLLGPDDGAGGTPPPRPASRRRSIAPSLASSLAAVQGIGLVLDADKRVIAWDCVFVSNGVNKEQRCRAEVRLEGGDGPTLLTLKLLDSSAEPAKEVPFGTCVVKGVDGLDVFPPSPSPSTAVASLHFPTTTARDELARLLHSFCEGSSSRAPAADVVGSTRGPTAPVPAQSLPVQPAAPRIQNPRGETSTLSSFFTAKVSPTPDPVVTAAASPTLVVTGPSTLAPGLTTGLTVDDLIRAEVSVDKERRVVQCGVERIITRRHKLKANETLAVEYTAVCLIGDDSAPTALQLFRSTTAAGASSTDQHPTRDPVDGVVLSVALLDPVTPDTDAAGRKGDASPDPKESTHAFHLRVYAFTPAVDGGQASELIKLKLKFKSAPETMTSLFFACFEGRNGARVVDALPNSIGTLLDFTAASGAGSVGPIPGRIRRLMDRVGVVLDTAIAAESYLSDKAALGQDLMSKAGSMIASLQSMDPNDVGKIVDGIMTVAGPAMKYVTDLAASVPFAGSIATAINGIFDAYQLVKARSSAVAQFLTLLGDVSLRFTDILNRCAGKLPKEPGWKPDGSDDLTQCLRESFKLVYSLTKQNVITKFIKANDTIAKLADQGSELQACLKAVQKAVKETVAELQLEFMADMHDFASDMKAANDELIQKIKDMSDKQNAASEANLTAIAKLMDVKAEDMKACMKNGFEKLTAEIVKQFDKDVGPYRLIDNPTFRYIWKNYLVGGDHVSRDTFVAALRSYWASKREATTGEVEDTLLTSANVTSLMNVMDGDGNGKMYVTEVNNALQQASLAIESDAATFEDLIKQLVETGKQQVVKKLLALHLAQYEDRRHELEAYIHPLVIKEVPGNMSLTEYVAKLDNPSSASGDTVLPVPEPLVPQNGIGRSSVFDGFLSGISSLFLLLGEPGSGKSLFSWHRCKLKEKEYVAVKDGLSIIRAADPWIPIAIDLKNYSLSGVKGLLNTYLEKECKLSIQELSMLRSLLQSQSNPSGGAVGHQKLKLLVFCDGFDELRAEESEAFSQSEFSDFTANLLFGLDVEAKVVVTCRDRHLKGGRDEENRVFQNGDIPHVRRVLLPFRSSQIDEYIERWTGAGPSTPASSTIASPQKRAQGVNPTILVPKDESKPPGKSSPPDAASPVPSTKIAADAESAHVRKLSTLQYQLAIRSSDSLQQIVRNPFVLRLFVDALPHLADASGRLDVSSVTRFAIYSVFVRQYIARQLKKFNLEGGNWMSSEPKSLLAHDISTSDDKLISALVELCGVIAGQMFASNRLTIELDTLTASSSLWTHVCKDYFDMDPSHIRSEAAVAWDRMLPHDRFGLQDWGFTKDSYVDSAERDARRLRRLALKHAKLLCPMRKIGDGYAFLHKSFYEFFLAALVLSVGSDALHSEELRVKRMTRVLGSGRGWQSEPEAIYFLCDKWWASGGLASASVVQQTRRCLFDVVKASSLASRQPVVSADGGVSSSVDEVRVSASANAVTLLNWANEPFSGVQWDGVQLAGADLSYAVFVGASLRGADLSRCTLKKAVLSGADLTGASLVGVNFAERAPVSVENGLTALVKANGLTGYEYRLVAGVVKVYTSAGEHRVSLYGKGAVRSVTAIEEFVAGVCETGDGIVWETRNFHRVWRINQVGCLALLKHSSGNRLLVGCLDGTVNVWDVDSQQIVSNVQPAAISACTAMCLDDTCATAGIAYESGAITVVGVERFGSLSQANTLAGDGIAITSIALSSSLLSQLQVVAVCSRGSNSVKVWRCSTGELLHALSGHTKPVTCLSFSTPVSGRPLLLATGAEDYDCRLWDVAAGQQYGPALQGHTGAVLSVEFEAGEHGMLSSVGADKQIRYWDIESANAYRERLQVSERVLAIHENTERTEFVIVDKSGGVFTAEVSRSSTEDAKWALVPRSLQRADAVSAASVISLGAVDTSGNPLVAMGGYDGSLRVWCNGSTLELGNGGKPIAHHCFVGSDKIAAVITVTGPPVHYGLFCDACKVSPIIGPRWKCSVCTPSFDMCGACYGDGTSHPHLCTRMRSLDSVYSSSLEVYGTAGGLGWSLTIGDGDKITALASSSPLLACTQTLKYAKDYVVSTLRCWDLSSASDQPLYSVKSAGVASCMAFSPTGSNQLVAVGISTRLELRDASNGVLARALTVHTSDVRPIACHWLSPSRLVSGYADATMRVWDVDTGVCQQMLSSVSKVQQLLTLPSANVLVSLCEDGILRVWDGATWELVTQSRSHVSGPFATEAQGVSLPSPSDVRLLETSGFDPELDVVCSAVVKGHTECVQLSQKLSRRLSQAASDAFKRAILRHNSMGGVTDVLFKTLLQVIELSKADATHAVAAGNAASCLNWLCSARQSSALSRLDWCGVRLIGADLRGADLTGTRFEGAELTDCDFTDATLTGVNFSDVDVAASTFVSASRVLPGSRLLMWSPTLSDGSAVLASVVDEAVIRLWQPGSGECIAMLKGHTSAVTCIAFGTRTNGTCVLASGSKDTSVRLWSVSAGENAIAALNGHTGAVVALTFGTRSDGRLFLASGGKDKVVRLWDVEAGGDASVLSGRTSEVTCLCFGTRSDGRQLLASGSKDNTVRVWDVEAGSDVVTVLSGHTDLVNRLSFCTRSDGKLILASGSKDTTIRLWDVEAGSDAIVLSGHTGDVTSLCFGTRSDGKQLLASGSDDKTVRLWDVGAGGDAVIVLNGHTDLVKSVDFCTRSNGKLLLASGSEDKSVRLWDVDAGGEAFAVLSGHNSRVTSLNFQNWSDGRLWLASGSWGDTVRLWDIEPLASVISTRRSSSIGARISKPALSTAPLIAPVQAGQQPAWLQEPDKPFLASGKLVATLTVRDCSKNRGIAVSPDGSALAVSNWGTHMITVYSLPDVVMQSEFGGEGSGAGQFNGPKTMCFSHRDSGHILIADAENMRVQEVTLAGAHVRSIGAGTIDNKVCGIAASADIVAVTAIGAKRLWMFDAATGDLLRSFGEKGKAEGRLWGPVAVRFTLDGGHILVAEDGNSRLSMFTLAGVFVRCIGVSSPRDLEFTPSGDIVVADSENPRICVFSADGSALLRSFGSEGDAPGQFRTPTALALHGDKLFVLDGESNRVQVFN